MKISIIIICIGLVCAQRGGNSDYDDRDTNWDNSYQETDTGAEKQQNKQEEGNSFWVPVLVLGFFGIVIYSSRNSDQVKKQRKMKIQKAFSQWEGKQESSICNLTKQEIQMFVNKLKNQKWQIRFQSQNGGMLDDGPLKFLEFSKKGLYSYNFKLEIHDNIGKSEGSGILYFQEKKSSMIFQKTYINRSAAGQEGSFDLLLYKGVQIGEKFKGQWSYQGYENNSQYSGKWELLNID